MSARFLAQNGNFSCHPTHCVIKCIQVVPNKVFLTKGVGVHKEKLASFELALRAAGLAHCNLVLVSSIYPPACKIISKEEGLKLLRPGEIIFAVYDRESNNEHNRLIAASVGLAIPADPSLHGYLSEHHSFGETDEKAGEYAEDLAASMLATTLGIEFNPELDWDEREDLFKMSGKIVRTSNMTQSAVGNKDGLWTTVFAAAVFINDDGLAVEAEKSQPEARSSHEDSVQDETSKQPVEDRETTAHYPEQAAGGRQAGGQEKARVPYEPALHTTSDQQEVTKALHRALRQEIEPSLRERAASTPSENDGLKSGRAKLPKPL
jgi:arginine decarboxylase